MTEPVLSVRDLNVRFKGGSGWVYAVSGVSWDLYPSETLGIVGESGAGKSVSVMSLIGLLPESVGRQTTGAVTYQGVNLLKLSERELRKYRGEDFGVVFQDIVTSLNPLHRIGRQIEEAVLLHNRGLSSQQAKQRTLELMSLAGISDPEARYRQYPHQLSGGMRQRVMISIAVANEPAILLCDEPTTALDVTIQAQVLSALQNVQRRTHAATVLVTHDLGLVAEFADRVIVMYGGKIVEEGPVESVFRKPRHPYTVGLLASRPSLTGDIGALTPIPGSPPHLTEQPVGCTFVDRCFLHQGRQKCLDTVPPLAEVEPRHGSACHFYQELETLSAQDSAALTREVTDDVLAQ